MDEGLHRHRTTPRALCLSHVPQAVKAAKPQIYNLANNYNAYVTCLQISSQLTTYVKPKFGLERQLLKMNFNSIDAALMLVNLYFCILPPFHGHTGSNCSTNLNETSMEQCGLHLRSKAKIHATVKAFFPFCEKPADSEQLRPNTCSTMLFFKNHGHAPGATEPKQRKG